MNNPSVQNAELAEALKAQMADIVTPAPVSAWPPAWGWWLVAALVLIALLAIIIGLIQRRRQNRYRKQALSELHSRTPANIHEQVQDLLTLTKACVLSVRPALRPEIAAMSADAWVQWLNSAGNKTFFDDEARAMVSDFAYQKSEQAPSPKLTQATSSWLRGHRLAEGKHA